MKSGTDTEQFAEASDASQFKLSWRSVLTSSATLVAAAYADARLSPGFCS